MGVGDLFRDVRRGTVPGPTMRDQAWRRAALTLMQSPDAVLLAMSDADFEALAVALGLENRPAVAEPAAAPATSLPVETREVA